VVWFCSSLQLIVQIVFDCMNFFNIDFLAEKKVLQK
jgi:hypothetical protein